MELLNTELPQLSQRPLILSGCSSYVYILLKSYFVHVLYFPFVSPAYQSELKQLKHNNMECSRSGCFYFAKRTYKHADSPDNDL